jgi:hypothetical protein
MSILRAPLATVLVVALLLIGCASLLGAETPEQQFYAAQGMYVIAMEEAVLYSRRPDADPGVMAVLRAADTEAYEALVKGRTFLMQPASPDRDQRLVIYANLAQVAISRLLEALEEEETP